MRGRQERRRKGGECLGGRCVCKGWGCRARARGCVEGGAEEEVWRGRGGGGWRGEGSRMGVWRDGAAGQGRAAR